MTPTSIYDLAEENDLDTSDLYDRLVFLQSEGMDEIKQLKILRDSGVKELNKEIKEIQEVLDKVGSEAKYGVQLIADHNFMEYAQDFARDMGNIKDINCWPCNFIDWDVATRILKNDYVSVVVCGKEFWYR